MLTLKHSVFSIGLLTFMAAVIFSAQANAQDKGSAQKSMEKTMQKKMTQTNFSDEKLKAFIVSASKVQDIQKKWMPQLQEAQNQKEAGEMKKNIQAKMVKVIKETENISVSEFQEISLASRKNNDLAQRLNVLAQNMTN